MYYRRENKYGGRWEESVKTKIWITKPYKLDNTTMRTAEKRFTSPSLPPVSHRTPEHLRSAAVSTSRARNIIKFSRINARVIIIIIIYCITRVFFFFFLSFFFFSIQYVVYK